MGVVGEPVQSGSGTGAVGVPVKQVALVVPLIDDVSVRESPATTGTVGAPLAM